MQEYKADMHIHTKYSFDSKTELSDIIRTMEYYKLKYIAFTDHVEFSNQPTEEVIHRITERNKKIDELQETTNIKLIKGLEISEPHLFEAESESIKEISDTDYILGSIHHIFGMPIKKMERNKNAYNLYLKSMLKMVTNADIDTLAHLDYLKRHISKGDFDKGLLKEILNVIIAKKIALEINTSGYRRCGEYFPSEEILAMYEELGGKRITFGSDAHTLNELYDNIPEASDQIKKYNLTPGVFINRNFRSIK